MKTKRKILLAVVSICLMLSMLPMIPVSATEVPPSKWDGTASMDWITAEAAQGEDTNSTAYNGNFYKVKNYAAGTTFVIDSAADLAGLAGLVNVEAHDSAHWFKNCTFYITENIDLNSAEHNWEPIGFFNQCGFSGTLVGSFDKADGTGGQITISNMKIVDSKAQTSWGGRNAGLVGTQTAGGIKNIVIDNANVTSSGSIGVFVGYVKNTASTYENCGATNSSVTGSVANIGGLFGYINVATTTVTNCSFSGTVTSTNAAEKGNVGGIVGYVLQTTKISNCTFDGTITSSTSCTGGIVGFVGVATTITNCDVKTGSKLTCTYNANKNYGAGGIVGYSSTAITLLQCDFDGTIDSKVKKTGGIIGYAGAAATITNCSVNGSLTSTYKAGDGNVDALLAGIVAHAENSSTQIKGCSVNAIIFNNCIGRMGGIVGYAANGVTVSDCVVEGSMSAITDTNQAKGGAAGVIALQRGTTNITNVVILTDISGASSNGTGGIIGFQDKDSVNTTISNVYVASKITDDFAAGGFIGSISGKNKISNCQFDGSFGTCNGIVGAYIGKYNTQSTTPELTIEKCINTAEKSADNAVGYASGTANSGKITITDSYSVTALGVANYQTESLWEVSGAVATKTAAELNTLVAGDDMKALWSARDNGRAPILKVAAGVAIANGAKAADSKIELVGLQKHLTENKVRLIAAVDGLDFERAGFDMHISYTKDGVTTYSKQVTELVTVCYTSYLDESGEAVDVVADRYYIIVELTGTDKLDFDSMTVSYNAFVENAGVRAYSTSGGQQAVVTAIQ